MNHLHSKRSSGFEAYYTFCKFSKNMDPLPAKSNLNIENSIENYSEVFLTCVLQFHVLLIPIFFG